ncbi:MAG: metallophosphoesterase [Acidobacteria bacterium]|nr:metallophosphoesterase [Acidobacteriota bacterium]
MAAVVLLLNLPLLIFFFPTSSGKLEWFSADVLRSLFYPSAAWMATLIAVLLLAVVVLPLTIVSAAIKHIRIWLRRVGGRRSNSHDVPRDRAMAESLGRRNILTAGPGLLVGAIYGIASYGVYSTMDEIDVSPELSIPIPNLPRSLEGMTIVQFSDIHVGPYVRERELRHIVNLTNHLKPDLITITGDVLDRQLNSLRAAVEGMRGLRASLGAFAVLGNHDYYADRYSSSRLRGGVRIQAGLESIGIRTLRNEVVEVGSGHERLALIGLDWLTTSPTDRTFYSYKPASTRRQLQRMLDQIEPGTPKVLLAHHPDTFQDVPDEIGLTLSGHTHGGGQVILGHVDNTPIGIATLRFKYLSGLYRRNGCSLYVNRGIGYLGLPIRINCPPEISRFKLVSA